MTICSDRFVRLADSESKTLGMEGLPIAIGKHPFGGINENQVEELSAAFVDQIIRGWTLSLIHI